MKNVIILILVLISSFTFGQASGSGTIDLKIFFEKDISIENIEPYYTEDNGSDFEYINYKIDSSENSITIKAHHSWVGASSFPTIVFSYLQDDNLFMFYLISLYIPPYKDRIIQEILFSFDKPNLYLNYEQGTIKADYIITEFTLGFPYGINKLIKIDRNEN